MDTFTHSVYQQLITTFTDPKHTLIIGWTGLDTSYKTQLFTDRLPSKQYETLVLYLPDEQTKETQKKLQKYFTKFKQTCICITQDTHIINLPKSSLSYTLLSLTTDAFATKLQQLTQLAHTQKQFTPLIAKLTHSLEKDPFTYGLFKEVQNMDFSVVVFFKSVDAQETFRKEMITRRDQNHIDTFHEDIFTALLQVSSQRPLFTEENAKILTDKIKSLYKRLLSQKKKHPPTSPISTHTKTNQEQTKKRQPIHTTYIKQTKGFLKKTILFPLTQTFQQFRVALYKQNKFDPVKQIPYEEYLMKGKKNPMYTLWNRRSLQKLKSQPKITILMVINDVDEIWLNKSVRSIKDQTYKNWELFLIDNCSPRTFLKSYLSSLNDPRIKTHFYNSKKTHTECLAYGLQASGGEFITILSEGDEFDLDALSYLAFDINNSPETDVVYTDYDEINEQGKRVHPFFKPDWDETMIFSFPYIDHMVLVRKELLERIEPFRNIGTREPIWDMFLKIAGATKSITHIPYILYHKRIRPLHKTDKEAPSFDAIKNFMARETIQGTIYPCTYPGAYYIIKKDLASCKISIVCIENRLEHIYTFLSSFKTNTKNYDITIVTQNHLTLDQKYLARTVQLGTSQFALTANTIVDNLDCDYVLFLDARTRVESADFIDMMLSVPYAHIVGTKILDPENVIQQSFYVKNLHDIVSTLYEGEQDHGQFPIALPHECSALSKRCLLIKRTIFTQVHFDTQFKSSYQDIDFCFAAAQNDLHISFVPDAKLRSSYAYTKEKFNELDTIRFVKKWKSELQIPDSHIQVKPLLHIKP